MDEQKLRLTEGSIWRSLVRFSLPLLCGAVFQQLYNAVDSWVVGRYCGDSALAAVSSSGHLCFLLIGFFQGVFVGASVIISNCYGARDREGTDRAIHTTVTFALGMGAVLSVLGVIYTPQILRWMNTPASVMPSSVLYFRIYCGGLLALVLYNTATGIFQALGDSRHPLIYLIISSAANVVMDLWFVAVLDWGVAGAALATVLGQLLSTVLGFAHLMSGRFVVRVSLRRLRPDWSILGNVFRLGLPSGVQNSVVAISNLVVQTNINAFGDAAMAGCGSYTKLEGFFLTPVISLAMAVTTFVSQNLGAQQQLRARQGARVGALLLAGLSETVGVLCFALSPVLIRSFSSTPEVVAFGVQQARILAPFYCLAGFSHGCAAVLRGAGRSMTSMLVLLSAWCVFRILYITVMVRLVPDIRVVFSAYPVTWVASTLVFLIILRTTNWSESVIQRKKPPVPKV